jgi:hypothetical protein
MAAKYARDQPQGFVNHIERVAIIGVSHSDLLFTNKKTNKEDMVPLTNLQAGGSIGRHITESLIATGKHAITVFTRADSKNTLPDGVRAAVHVDYDDEETLVSALQGQQFLIITLSMHAAPDTHSKIVRAAKKAGIEHIMPNVYTCDIVLNNQDLGDEVMMRGMHAPVLEDMERQGVAYTVLVCGLWYEFSLACPPDFLGFDIAKREVTLFDEGANKVNLSTWTRLGKSVASFLSLKLLPDDENDTTSVTVSGYRNKPLYISSFHTSQRDMLASLQRVTGTSDADWTIRKQSTDERIKQGREMAAQGNMSGVARVYFSRMFSAKGQAAVFQEKLDNGVLGLKEEEEEDMDEATGRAVAMVDAGWSPY